MYLYKGFFFLFFLYFSVLPCDGWCQNYYRNGENVLFKMYVSANIHAWKLVK